MNYALNKIIYNFKIYKTLNILNKKVSPRLSKEFPKKIYKKDITNVII